MKRLTQWPPFVWPILAAIICFGVYGPGLPGAALLMGGVTLALWIGPKELDFIGQIIFSLFLTALCYALFFVWQTPPDHTVPWKLGPLAQMVSAAILLAATLRLAVQHPIGGPAGSAILMLCAWMVLALGRFGVGFIPLSVIGLGLVFFATGQMEPHRRPTHFTQKNRLMTGGIILFTTLLSTVAISRLPVMYDNALDRYYDRLYQESTGFGSQVELGSLNNLSFSNEVVLRIFGPPGAIGPLRGKVYRTYQWGRWSVEPDPYPKTIPFHRQGPAAGTYTMEITGGRQKHYFLPLSATHLQIDGPPVHVDKLGIVTPLANRHAERISFVLGDKPEVTILKPDDTDLQVPSQLRAVLSGLPLPKGNGDMAHLTALTSFFRRNYHYATRFTRKKGVEPLVDFLTDNKQGHCEYFAAAMVMAARTKSIPARLVTGYNVTEYNRLLGYHVVRNRNAHAFVEAYVDGHGWTTFDPTPPSEVAYHMGAVTTISDSVVALGLLLIEKLSSMSGWQLLGTIFALILLWVVIRLIRRLLQMVRRRPHVVRPVAYDPADEAFIKLMRRLRKTPYARKPNELIDHWANRIAELDHQGIEVAGLISSYESWRYGKTGSLESIRTQIEQWLAGTQR